MSIAISSVTGGLGLGTFGSAAASSFATEVVAGALTGEFDLGQALAGAAFAGVSSWATSVINADTFGITFGEGANVALLGFGDDLTLAAIVEGGIDSAVTAGLSSVVYGSDFGSGFLSSFSSSIVTLATADFQALIGKQGLKEGGFEHAGLHALVGCVAAELSSANCASGAIGGIAQSIYAGNTGILERHINKDKHLANVEMVSALAAYFTSQGKGENVSIGARIGRSGFENNALCGGLCILAAIAAGYVLGTGEGDPIEGLRRIGRGEDLLSELAGLAGEEALAFATDNFPEQTAVVINAMIAAGEVANVVIQWTDEATGQVVSSTWNDIPQSTRDAIVGGTKVATFLIPAGSAGRILRRVPEVGPRLNIRDHYAHHRDMQLDVIEQLEAQGYRVADGEVSFGAACGTGRCRPDIIYRTPDGQVRIIEIKTGNADLSIRQSEIFPQINSGDAIPRGDVARRFGLLPNIPLRDQGYPNGIPIDIQTFPGAGQ